MPGYEMNARKLQDCTPYEDGWEARRKSCPGRQRHMVLVAKRGRCITSSQSRNLGTSPKLYTPIQRCLGLFSTGP